MANEWIPKSYFTLPNNAESMEARDAKALAYCDLYQDKHVGDFVYVLYKDMKFKRDGIGFSPFSWGALVGWGVIPADTPRLIMLDLNEVIAEHDDVVGGSFDPADMQKITEIEEFINKTKILTVEEVKKIVTENENISIADIHADITKLQESNKNFATKDDLPSLANYVTKTQQQETDKMNNGKLDEILKAVAGLSFASSADVENVRGAISEKLDNVAQSMAHNSGAVLDAVSSKFDDTDKLVAATSEKVNQHVSDRAIFLETAIIDNANPVNNGLDKKIADTEKVVVEKVTQATNEITTHFDAVSEGGQAEVQLSEDNITDLENRVSSANDQQFEQVMDKLNIISGEIAGIKPEVVIENDSATPAPEDDTSDLLTGEGGGIEGEDGLL